MEKIKRAWFIVNFQKKMERLELLRFNISDDYNLSMGGVNVAYQFVEPIPL